MFNSLKTFFLKTIYRFLIIKIFILPKYRLNHYNNIPPTLTLNVKTTHGVFIFNYKEDQRKSGSRNNDLFFNTFMISLSVPENMVLAIPELANTVIVAVKLKLVKVNHIVLAEILTDIYLDRFLKHAKKF